MTKLALILAASCCALVAQQAVAREYFIGGPVEKLDMEIVANYLKGIEMSPMPPGMEHGGDQIHLEADVHATADNQYGFADGSWIPYLTITYDLEKTGSDFKAMGKLLPMTAKDGAHYANNVAMGGDGTYKVTYRIVAPEAAGFYRHIDKETGVPDWWKEPITVSFTFKYPQK